MSQVCASVVTCLHIIVQFSFMSDGLGDVIFIAALIAKNWRIYRIFNNRKLEDIVS